MRMVMELAAPGVKDSQEARVRSPPTYFSSAARILMASEEAWNMAE